MSSDSINAVNYDISNSTDTTVRTNLITCTRRHTFNAVGIFYGQNPLHFAFPLLLVELSMAVIVTQLVRHILKPLKQPTIIAEIIGGVIVGQIAVGKGTANFLKHVFPADSRFVLRNIGILGFMYFLFVAGLKTDIRLLKKAGRKQWLIALVSIFVPLVCGLTASIVMPKGNTIGNGHFASLFGVSSLFSVTAFPVLNPIIKELDLLSSEIGRLSMSLALISVVMGVNFSLVFESAYQGSLSLAGGIYSVISFLILTTTIILGIRRLLCKLVKETPIGKRIPEFYVISILVGVLVSGFLSNTFGMAFCNGPMWLGLAIPDGPPLGAILVEKTETIVNNFFMPLAYVFLGMSIELPLLDQQWFVMKSFVYVSLLVVCVKTLATFLVSYFVKLPAKDALALTLLLNLRGQMEIILLLRYVDFRLLTGANAAVVLLIILSVNAISTIGITFLYNTTRPFMVNKRRTIQHTPVNSELRIVACFFDDTSVIGVLNLIEFSNPPINNTPICIYVLHLVELVAQVQPIQIEHGTDNMDDYDQETTYASSLIRALDRFKNSIAQEIEIHLFTIITAKKSMYQDICLIALQKKASLIVLPVEHQNNLIINTPIPILSTTPRRAPVGVVSNDVLHNAPCSVACFTNTSSRFLDNNLSGSRRSGECCYAIVLFTGGPDSREALSYADRIMGNENVNLTLIRFLPRDGRGDNKYERKLDEGLITWFWMKHEMSRRVFYKEVIVSNGEETVSAIQDLATDDFHLYIIGRKNETNTVILQGLADWSENNELGPLGDYIASSDIGRTATLIVMQQQILRV